MNVGASLRPSPPVSASSSAGDVEAISLWGGILDFTHTHVYIEAWRERRARAHVSFAPHNWRMINRCSPSKTHAGLAD